MKLITAKKLTETTEYIGNITEIANHTKLPVATLQRQSRDGTILYYRDTWIINFDVERLKK